MGLVDDHQKVFRKVIDECRRRLALLAPRKMAAVVLDPVAVAKLAHHLEIEQRPLRQPLRLEEAILRAQLGQAPVELLADVLHRHE